MASILVVEPERKSLERLSALLTRGGHGLIHAPSASEALRCVQSDQLDLVLMELRLPDRSGMALLADMKQECPCLPVVVIAAESSATEAIEAMRAGAADCLTRGLDAEELEFVLGKVLAQAARQSELPEPRKSSPSRMIGNAPSICEMREKLTRLAASRATVLIRGESGTGKELVARAIHDASPRHAGPFVKIDCTSLPEGLLESELFGYEKGAFTGAVNRKLGRVELADGGTLFLDEIGDLPAGIQAKLLRLLQERQFERLGGKRATSVDVRFVCATHQDLEALIANQEFREDLFYRLNGAPLWLPPLRSRRSDIDLLVAHFLERIAGENGLAPVSIGSDALALLRSQRWPGNVRQLENFVERLTLLADGPLINLDQVQRELSYRPVFKTQSTGTAEPLAHPAGVDATPNISPLEDASRAAEARVIQAVLGKAGGNRTVAARLLGVSRTTLYNKLKEFGMLARN